MLSPLSLSFLLLYYFYIREEYSFYIFISLNSHLILFLQTTMFYYMPLTILSEIHPLLDSSGRNNENNIL